MVISVAADSLPTLTVAAIDVNLLGGWEELAPLYFVGSVFVLAILLEEDLPP